MLKKDIEEVVKCFIISMYLNTITLLQYCWCHSGCSCLNGYDIVMFLGFIFQSLLKSFLLLLLLFFSPPLGARGVFFFFFLFFTLAWSACSFLKAGPLPCASQAIHWAAHFYSAMVCYTPQSAQSTGRVCDSVCVSVCVCVDQTTVTSRPEP